MLIIEYDISTGNIAVVVELVEEARASLAWTG
jgi:hypothetical protein